MNTQSNITAPKTAPVPSIDELETSIFNAIRMASILSDLLERSISKRNAASTYALTAAQAENILFAAYQTSDFLQTVRTEWEALS